MSQTTTNTEIPSLANPIEIQNKLKDDVISPATIVNMRFQSKNSEDFLKLLEKV